MIKRLSFLLGLLLGLASVALAGAAILTYLFTGQMAAIEMEDTDGGRRPVFKLVSPDEVIDLVKGGRRRHEGEDAATEEVAHEG
jgi:hypothetical protein